MDKEVAFENLTRITSLLGERGIRAWLDGGSLLGLYRSGELIDHDTDTDLGIHIADWRREPALDFVHAMKAAGFTFVHYQGHLGEGLKIGVERSGVHTDLFFYYPEADRVWCGAWIKTWHRVEPGAPKHRRLVKYYYEPFELGSLRVKGVDFHVPADTEKFLVTLYGASWRVPDASWGHLSSPPNAVLTTILLDSDRSVFVEEDFLARGVPGLPGHSEGAAPSASPAPLSPLVAAVERARARKLSSWGVAQRARAEAVNAANAAKNAETDQADDRAEERDPKVAH